MERLSKDIKVAYVKGIGNMADFETAASGSSQAPCISKGFVAELKTKTIDQVIAEVDKFYQENPAKAGYAGGGGDFTALHQALRSGGGEKMMRTAVILLVVGVHGRRPGRSRPGGGH